ncbi:TIGR04211 family SH3 domain-containing protein [Solimonas terrae]|uniref:TIGR04211 family SH3 domain-containing protein n=1 Tax=Solimonas terrae TaxID=1396819 RepID=A0A6M2BVG1_9GAMM|nr:TIGR04211 family SH3 domain-containing protein [Solimonas terrae]NGY06478.1 TIGR04211 family SH3 domain-containing protein [Solimonas terrae]
MNRVPLLLALALVVPLAHAEGTPQYITDDVSVTLREAPRNDAGSVGVLHSGDQVAVLETLGEQSFARVRSSSGVEGWMTARYLSPQPAARDRLSQMKSDLDSARAQIKSLQDELKSAKAQIDSARPAFELSQENTQLKSALAAKQQAMDAVTLHFDAERAKRATLIAGAGLLSGGVILGLLLPWLLQNRRRRRYGDF